MLKSSSLHSYKILVTGACGFLGRRLVEILLDKGTSVVGVDSCNSSSNPFAGIPQHASFHFIHGGFQERRDEIVSELGRKGKLAVFHMAGFVNVEECKQNPVKAFESNVMLTFQVLEFCKRNGVNRFVFPSTGLVYGDYLKRPATEKDVTFPQNIYVATKLSAEAGVQGYSETFGLTSVIARLGNVYGPNSHPDTVVGTLIRQIKKGKKLVFRNLSAIRDFIYIDDVIEGLVRLLYSAEEVPGCYVVNLSTGVGSSVKKLLETACRVHSIPFDRIQFWKNSRPQGSRLILDNHLLVKMTGWKPRYTLAEGLSLLLNDGCNVTR
jgi:nucleoside-diphosphate-sugar epimerase